MNQREERSKREELEKSFPGYFKKHKPKTWAEKIKEYNAGIRRLQEKIRRKQKDESQGI